MAGAEGVEADDNARLIHIHIPIDMSAVLAFLLVAPSSAEFKVVTMTAVKWWRCVVAKRGEQ